MIRNIIFDWSGTLSDDVMPSYVADSAVFVHFGVKPFSFSEWRRNFTLPYMDFYQRFIGDISQKETEKIFSDNFRRGEKPKPFPGIKKVISALRDKGVTMVVLSAHHQEFLEAEVMEYGLSGFFLELCGGVNDKRLAIDGLLKRNKFKPSDTAYLGDMTHDIEAGKKAGVKTFAVTWGYQPEDVLAGSNPDLIIKQISDIVKIVG